MQAGCLINITCNIIIPAQICYFIIKTSVLINILEITLECQLEHFIIFIIIDETYLK